MQVKDPWWCNILPREVIWCPPKISLIHPSFSPCSLSLSLHQARGIMMWLLRRSCRTNGEKARSAVLWGGWIFAQQAPARNPMGRLLQWPPRAVMGARPLSCRLLERRRDEFKKYLAGKIIIADGWAACSNAEGSSQCPLDFFVLFWVKGDWNLKKWDVVRNMQVTQNRR